MYRCFHCQVQAEWCWRRRVNRNNVAEHRRVSWWQHPDSSVDTRGTSWHCRVGRRFVRPVKLTYWLECIATAWITQFTFNNRCSKFFRMLLAETVRLLYFSKFCSSNAMLVRSRSSLASICSVDVSSITLVSLINHNNISSSLRNDEIKTNQSCKPRWWNVK